MNIEVYFYNRCIEVGLTKEGACALMGNIKGESGFNPKNLEDTANRKLGMSDEQYTAMVDSGEYTNFIHDGAGYGLAQTTYYTRKEWMLGFARNYGSSIGDYKMQTDYILWELYNKYRAIWNRLTTENDLESLTWVILDKWENPKEKTENMRRRYNYAQDYYACVKNQDGKVPAEEESSSDIGRDVTEKYTQLAIAIANDNSHGYSQANRWGPDYDCSSLVITCVQMSGIPVKDRGATYTGNMRQVFLACGFKDVTASCNLANGSGMQRGDILLNDVNHTAIYIGNGQLVHARSSEGNTIQGDQSGNEIRTQGYFNYPWNAVFRLGSGAAAVSAQTGESVNGVPMLKKGSKGANVKILQQKLIELHYDVGPDGADGDYGENTCRAVAEFQRDHGLEIDGVFGPETYAAMKDAKPKYGGTQATTSSGDSVSVGVTVNQNKTDYLSKGKTVRFAGSMCYTSADGNQARACRPGKAKITNVKQGAKHPYFLVRTLLGGSNVYGWVNADEVEAVLK